MIYKSTREEVQAYFQNPSLNQSELKLLKDYSLSAYQTEHFKRSDPKRVDPDHFRQGGAVDILLTGSPQDFDEEYHVSNADKLPSETIIKIMDLAFKLFVAELSQEIAQEETEVSIEEVIKDLYQKINSGGTARSDFFIDIEPYILNACNLQEYFTNRKDDSRIASALKAGTDYLLSLFQAFGKTILPAEMYSNIKAIVSNFKNSPKTGIYFDQAYFDNNPNMDIYYQKIIYFTYQGIPCKAMLDILIVDKSQPDAVYFHPVDVKTLQAPVIDFPIAAKNLRYDIQAAWYKLAIIHSDIAQNLAAEKREFKLNNFRFLSETTTPSFRTKPLVWTMKSSMVEIGFKGKPEIRSSTGDLIKPGILGINQLIKIHQYHSEKQDFTTEKIVDENPSEIPFDWNFSKLTEWF